MKRSDQISNRDMEQSDTWHCGQCGSSMLYAIHTHCAICGKARDASAVSATYGYAISANSDGK